PLFSPDRRRSGLTGSFAAHGASRRVSAIAVRLPSLIASPGSPSGSPPPLFSPDRRRSGLTGSFAALTV
ncbi:MAG: hypothetical protein WKF86_11705, partial [Acidimicrobiales bacterium]